MSHFKRSVLHCRAAVLHHDRLLCKALEIGQRFGEHRHALQVGQLRHRLYMRHSVVSRRRVKDRQTSISEARMTRRRPLGRTEREGRCGRRGTTPLRRRPVVPFICSNARGMSHYRTITVSLRLVKMDTGKSFSKKTLSREPIERIQVAPTRLSAVARVSHGGCALTCRRFRPRCRRTSRRTAGRFISSDGKATQCDGHR